MITALLYDQPTQSKALTLFLLALILSLLKLRVAKRVQISIRGQSRRASKRRLMPVLYTVNWRMGRWGRVSGVTSRHRLVKGQARVRRN